MGLASRADWLHSLRPAIHRWIEQQCRTQHEWCATGKSPTGSGSFVPANQTCTEAYADLTLAFGLALLGRAPVACQQLVDGARARIDSRDRAHNFLVRAYEYRVRQALDGTPGRGALPAGLPDELKQSSRLSPGEGFLRDPEEKYPAYTVDRLRSRSEILEPHGGVEPVLRAYGPNQGWQQGRWLLCDIASPDELAERGRGLIETAADQSDADRAWILRQVLELSPRMGEGPARDLLSRVASLLADLPDPNERAAVAGAALAAAAALGQNERAREFVAPLHELAGATDGGQLVRWRDDLWRRSIHALRRLGLWEDLARLVDRLEASILQGEEVGNLRRQLHQAAYSAPDQANDWMAPLRGLLYVAGGWSDLGRTESPDRILSEVRELLQTGGMAAGNQAKLAWAYARTLGRLADGEGQRRAEELLERVQGVCDTYSTGTHYALAPLTVVESLVIGMTAESRLMTPPCPSSGPARP